MARAKIRWKRRPGGLDSACGRFRVWLGGDEAWYGEADGSASSPFPYRKSAQQWCQHKADDLNGGDRWIGAAGGGRIDPGNGAERKRIQR